VLHYTEITDVREIQIGFGFTFLVPAHPGSPGQNPESRKMVVVVSRGARYLIARAAYAIEHSLRTKIVEEQ